MSKSDSDLQLATDAIVTHGCPICGERPNFYFVNDPETIDLSPCGHSVSPADALDMAEIQRQIDSRELKGDN